jgi:hypothetical protein
VDPLHARLHRASSAFLLAGAPAERPSPFQSFRNPIHDARPVVSPRPAPISQPHPDRLIYDA